MFMLGFSFIVERKANKSVTPPPARAGAPGAEPQPQRAAAGSGRQGADGAHPN